MDFDGVVRFLESLGYAVKITQHPYLFGTVKNSDVRIGFCESNGGQSYSYIDGRIAIDREDCFDKWSKCPVCLPFPQNDLEEQFLVDTIKWLQTDDGYKVSNEYDIDNWVREYPKFI